LKKKLIWSEKLDNFYVLKISLKCIFETNSILAERHGFKHYSETAIYNVTVSHYLIEQNHSLIHNLTIIHYGI